MTTLTGFDGRQVQLHTCGSPPCRAVLYSCTLLCKQAAVLPPAESRSRSFIANSPAPLTPTCIFCICPYVPCVLPTSAPKWDRQYQEAHKARQNDLPIRFFIPLTGLCWLWHTDRSLHCPPLYAQES
uniref:Uncharacterized protein n=1 Tax=Eutreptiella gymnastica TaxID=73025 RepID=A0A7S1JD90_9EUGL